MRLALSLASQAAVAYENRKLYNDIQTLFEGFVSAAVTAIEQRDPTTSGHSLRVATYTGGLAEIVDRTHSGPYATTRFDLEQMREIRYAALLHDFGKVGVREDVLVKAKKALPDADGSGEAALRLHSQGNGNEHGAPQAAGVSGARSRRRPC